MKKLCSLYPQMNEKDNSSYTYYTDSGKKISLVAGKEGVTEEHISALKTLHRQEALSDHRQKCYRRYGEHFRATTCSLDALREETNGDSPLFMDERSDCEKVYLEAEAEESFMERLTTALTEMTDEQRALFNLVWIKKVSVRELARQEGVTERTIRYRISQIINCL